jgi:hypothetical protein
MGVAQEVEHLSGKYKALSSNPSTVTQGYVEGLVKAVIMLS